MSDSMNDFRAFFPDGGVTSAPRTTPRSDEEIKAGIARASARGRAAHAKNGNILAIPSFEQSLVRYGDEARHLRKLQAEIDNAFGLAPDWTNKRLVKSWASGLHELWVASRENLDVVVAAGKKLRENGMTIATPRSLTNMARSIAAERASTAATLDAVRVYR
jgi:hypothetical protein